MKIIHKTKYKNLILTVISSIIGGILCFGIGKLFITTENYLNIIFGILIGLVLFYYIGKKMIIRHLIGENFNIKIEFLLQPNYELNYTRADVKNIEFETFDYGRYGIYEKGIIMLKNNNNYHRNFITFDWNNEINWFWTNFKYPNKI